MPDDDHGVAFGRAPGDVLNIVYLTPAQANSGGFYPTDSTASCAPAANQLLRPERRRAEASLVRPAGHWRAGLARDWGWLASRDLDQVVAGYPMPAPGSGAPPAIQAGDSVAGPDSCGTSPTRSIVCPADAPGPGFWVSGAAVSLAASCFHREAAIVRHCSRALPERQAESLGSQGVV